MDESPQDLPEHTRPNVSQLETYRSEVALARRRNWPYRAIAELLLERHALRISGRAISDFCQRRRIQKGVGETHETGRPAIAGRPDLMTEIAPSCPNKGKGRFVPHDGPLRTKSNGLLSRS